ncbi:MAG: MFS transporter [Planctomycetes bacterium]|nr:MFS transporter [Planctomycetota bacterium]
MNRELPIASEVLRETAVSSSKARWLALAAALLGWMFDGAEMGVFSMVGRPAVKDLLPGASEADVGLWFGVITAGFLVGAATGGVLFGWLGDRIGRVRAMTLSVFTYAVFTGLCGLVGSAWQSGVLRLIAALGMGGEWSLGVALVMEVWPNRSRAFMAGLIGAAANVGYMMVGFVGLGLATILSRTQGWLMGWGMGDELAGKLVANEGWRLMMLLGTLPALLTFFIRLFVPESERWKREQGRGATSNWASRDLLGVLVGAAGPALVVYLWAWDGPNRLPHTVIVRLFGTLLGIAVATVGYTFPVVRYLQRQASDEAGEHALGPTLRRMLLGACLSGVALLGTWGSSQWGPAWANKLTEADTQAGVLHHAKEYTQIWMAIGAIVGTITAALLGDWLGRRLTYSLFCVLSLGSVLLFYQGNTAYGPRFLVTGFLGGVCTASFYGWLPLYLPELFRTNIRATGQGFGFNFGRILAAVGALQTGVLFKTDIHLGSLTLPAGYPSACSLISLIYVVGVVLIWLGPEMKGKLLPE